jgi:hypothetical protein
MRNFLPLRIRVAAIIEVVESYREISGEGMAEDLLTQQIDHVGS